MPTNVTKLPFTLPASVGGIVIDIPTAAEVDLFNDPSLLAWLTPTSGFATTTWTDAKAGLVFSRVAGASDGQPTLVAGGQNGQSYLQWDKSCVFAAPAGSPLLPVAGDYSIVAVAHAGAPESGLASRVGAIWANYKTATSTEGGVITGATWFGWEATAAARVIWSQQTRNGAAATTVHLRSTAVYPNSAGPKMFNMSFDYGERDGILRVNNGQDIISNLAVDRLNQNDRLCIGGGTDGTVFFQPDSKMRLYDLLVFNKPLAKASAATTLAKVEAWAKEKYALWS